MFGGITAAAGGTDDRQVHLRGKSKSGRRWEAHLSNLDEVWRGDLDGNGVQDYVLFASGPYFNGRTTPPFSLSILLMDHDGMPTPFFTAVYKGEDGNGVRHLVDLDRDGRAELLISTYDERPSDPHVGGFCSGHWITQLYRFKNLGVEEMRGAIGSIPFPFIHNWSYRGTECADVQNALLRVQPPIFYEHGTGVQGLVVETASRSAERTSDAFTIVPAGGCKTVTAKVIVYDRSRLREIAFPNLFSEYSNELMEKIWRAGARVQLRGISGSVGKGNCAVNLLWAE